uniref:Uncharacterized protein n=1 Tax=Avena sativa TaxID=4498 RepID=A0ACD5TM51_AVESA
MVKILEIGSPLDAEEEDDDCCEIGLAEFAKKVNLKAADDDVVVVAAKGPIKLQDIRRKKIKVKVEVDQPGHCSDTSGNLHEHAAGDRIDNPYEIVEDEPTIHKKESVQAKPGVKCDIKSPVKRESEPFVEVAADMLPVKCEPVEGNGADELFVNCESESFEEAVADMSPAKSEHEDGNGADEHFEEVIPDMPLLKFGSLRFEAVNKPVKSAPEHGNDHFEEVVPDPDMFLLKCEYGCFEEVIPDMSVAKCEPEEGSSADLLFEPAIPDMSPVNSESESFEEVTADMSPAICEPEEGNGADVQFEEVIPDIPLLKFGSLCFEEVIAEMPPLKCAPEDGNGLHESVQVDDAYDHLPEMDTGGRVVDEEDADDFVVVGREAL